MPLITEIYSTKIANVNEKELYGMHKNKTDKARNDGLFARIYRKRILECSLKKSKN